MSVPSDEPSTSELTPAQRAPNTYLVFTWAWFAGACVTMLFVLSAIVLFTWYPIYWLVTRPLAVFEGVAVGAAVLMLAVAFGHLLARLF